MSFKSIASKRVMVLAAVMVASFVICLAAAQEMVITEKAGWVFPVSFAVFSLTVIYINRHKKELEAEIRDLD